MRLKWALVVEDHARFPPPVFHAEHDQGLVRFLVIARTEDRGLLKGAFAVNSVDQTIYGRSACRKL